MDINDKIKSNAVWENIDDLDRPILPENITPDVSLSVSKTHCYNCLKEIPDNSKFCPWCQIELFVKCPKCENSYSSQYPACNQCGTNRKVYMREQNRLRELRLEKQRKEEEKKRREEEEKKRREEEQKQAAEAIKNRFIFENLEIIKTSQFMKTEVLLNEYEKYYHKFEKKHSILFPLGWILMLISIILILFPLFEDILPLPLIEFWRRNVNSIIIISTIGFIGMLLCWMFNSHSKRNKINSKDLFIKFIKRHSIDSEIKPIIDEAIVIMKHRGPSIIFAKKTDFIILSYRKAFHKQFELYQSLFPFI